MSERQFGCICELKENGEPVVLGYALCPVHKPDALTPKVVAQGLVEKFYKDKTPDGWADAKSSALISVTNILEILEAFTGTPYGKILIPFYEQVKQEIPLL